MKKIFRLTINELIKQIYKKGFVIALTVVICLSILIPLMTPNYVKEQLYNYDGYEPYYGMLQEMGDSPADLLIYYDNISNGKYEEEEDAVLYLEFLSEYKKQISKYNGIFASYSSYRYVTYETIANNIKQNVIAQMQLDGKEIKDNHYFKQFGITIDTSLAEEELISLIEANNEQNKLNENIVLNYDFGPKFKNDYEEISKTIKLNEDSLQYYTNLETNNDPKLQKEKQEQIDSINKELIYLKSVEEIYKELLNREIKGAESEYIINYLDKYMNLYSESNEEILDESSYLAYDYTNYEEYVKIRTMEKEKAKEDAEIIKYALLNNINYNKNGIKKTFKLLYVTLPIIVGIFVISFTSTIVADETSKSTIRSLIAKPNKKWKVLTSKFLASLLIMLGMVFIYVICFTSVLFIIYGMKDLSTPMLLYDNGVIEVPYLVFVLKQISISIIPLIFVTILSVCISTYFSAAMISAGASAVILVLHTTLTAILGLGSESIIVYTFLPHLNVFYLTDFLTLTTWTNRYNYDFTLSNSIFVLLLNAAFFITLAYGLFIKKEIK